MVGGIRKPAHLGRLSNRVNIRAPPLPILLMERIQTFLGGLRYCVRRSSCALIATIIVLSDISTIPTTAFRSG